MLKNDALVAKFGVDTAEMSPLKFDDLAGRKVRYRTFQPSC